MPGAGNPVRLGITLAASGGSPATLGTGSPARPASPREVASTRQESEAPATRAASPASPASPAAGTIAGSPASTPSTHGPGGRQEASPVGAASSAGAPSTVGVASTVGAASAATVGPGGADDPPDAVAAMEAEAFALAAYAATAGSPRGGSGSYAVAHTVPPRRWPLLVPGDYWPERGHCILCFGDSLTEGYCEGGRTLTPYSLQLARALTERASELEVVNAGISGEETAAMLPRLPLLLHRGPPPTTGAVCYGLVLILGGTNDLARVQRDRERILHNLVTLHCAAHDAGARSGVLTVPFLRTPWQQVAVDADRTWLNEQLRAFARSRPGATLLIDLDAAFPQDAEHEAFWDPDGVHLSSAGYDAMGSLVHASLFPPRPAALVALDAAWAFAPLPEHPLDATCEVVQEGTDPGCIALVLRWLPPANVQPAAVSHHLVEVRVGDDGPVVVCAAVPLPQVAARLAPLSRSRSYRVCVSAVGSAGPGPGWGFLVPAASAGPPVLPSPGEPAEFMQLMDLRWGAPQGCVGVMGYRVWARVLGTEHWDILAENTGDPAPRARCAVPRGALYEFCAAPLTAAGLQPHMCSPSAQTLPNFVQGLRAVEVERPEWEAIGENVATVHVSWSEPVGGSFGDPPVLDYRLCVFGSDAGPARQPLLVKSVGAPCTEAWLCGFARGSEYTITVRAASYAGEGPDASVTLALSPPPEPPEGSAARLTPGQREFRATMRRRWGAPTNVQLGLHLRRATLFDDTVAVFGVPHAAAHYLQADQRLQIRFDGEAGVDEGGLLREWLSLSVGECCRPERGYLRQLEDDGHVWPSLVGWNVAPEESAAAFRTLGRLVGVALASGNCPGFKLHPVFWRWAFPTDGGGDVDYFAALRHFDRAQFIQRARLAYSREQLAEALGLGPEQLSAALPDWRPLSEAETAELELTWDYDAAVCGASTSVPLRSGGGGGPDRPVAGRDAAEFLRLWARQHIIGSVEAQLATLRDGIVDVVPAALLVRLAAAELQELVAGVGWSVQELLPHIDVVVVREAESPRSTQAAMALVGWLAAVLTEFTPAQREAFLRYVTGSPNLPAGGAAALRPKLTLQVIPGAATATLPVAHTCVNLLDLPLYPDFETLRTRLLTALRFGDEGFGLA